MEIKGEGLTEKEMEEELYLIKSFPTWRHYPVCPMVNRVKKAPDGIPEVGFLLGADVMQKRPSYTMRILLIWED